MKLKLLFLLMFFTGLSFAQITGLSGWNIYVDPGHSMKENMGVYNYSEAEKVLRVGLHLREMLLTTTDIDTVYITRTNDQVSVGLTQRCEDANTKGAAWFHSIHSNAGGSEANNILLLWGQYSNGLEKVPNGGKAMSSFVLDNLVRAYRIPSNGSRGDCTFYGCSGTGPYLAVNRITTMPSELSESGYHTNSRQNQLNMNEMWKKMEAKAFFFSFLNYKNVQIPFVGTANGIITNLESGEPINGAVVNLNGLIDTTDTYQSLFHKYTTDPNLLHNGYYYFENLTAGTFPISVTAPNYYDSNSTVTILDTFFTFKDIKLISKVPPFQTTIAPAMNDSIYLGLDDITINFSRPMNRETVEQNIIITPAAPLTFNWLNGDQTLVIKSDSLNYATAYQLVITGLATDKYNHPFDGNKDGVGGDSYTHNFFTKPQDVAAPVITNVDPAPDAANVDLQPIISLVFDEQINTGTLSGKITVVKSSDNTSITATMKHYLVNRKSVINIFPRVRLVPNEHYTLKLTAGVEDIYGNAISADNNYTFTTGSSYYTVANTIDNFESGTGWWQPQQSSSTVGIINDLTSSSSSGTYFIPFITGSKSLKIDYAWNTSASTWLIREHNPSTSPAFTTDKHLQTFIFGDGSGTKYRFCVNDGANMNGHEVSQWYTIDWLGWKLVSWDLTNDPVGVWIGDGVLNAPLSMDSYQLTFSGNNNTNIGAVYFDDLRVTSKTVVGVEEENSTEIKTFALMQNYPNPFNPSTVISFNLPEEGQVSLDLYNSLGQKIKTLISDFRNRGTHSFTLNTNDDGLNLSSGIYFYKLNVNSSTKSYSDTKKLILMK